MAAAEFFVQLAGILIAARFMAEVATRLGAPSVIGELAAGIILGPSVLGLIEPTEIIRLLAEIGIILLLFEVGLETDIGRLARIHGHRVGARTGSAPRALGPRADHVRT